MKTFYYLQNPNIGSATTGTTTEIPGYLLSPSAIFMDSEWLPQHQTVYNLVQNFLGRNKRIRSNNVLPCIDFSFYQGERFFWSLQEDQD